MNYDPHKAIRQAMMIARRQAAYGGSYEAYSPQGYSRPITQEDLDQAGGNFGAPDPGAPTGAPGTGNFGTDLAGFAEAAGPAMAGAAMGAAIGGVPGAVAGMTAASMAQGLAEATGLSAPATSPVGGLASVAGNIAQTQMGMTPTSNPAEAVAAAVTGPQSPADQEDADQGAAAAAAAAAAQAAAEADNTNSMADASMADAAGPGEGDGDGDGGDGGGGDGSGFAQGGDVKGRMDPRSLPGIHVRVPIERTERDAGGPVSQEDENVRIDNPIMGYHSSPHDFDQFDLSKIGTGEGNQMYGHGLYFAENPKVSGQGGDYWRQFFNKMKSSPETSAAGALFANKFDYEKAIGAISSGLKYYEDRAIPGRYGEGPEAEEGYRLLADNDRQALKMLEERKIVGPRTYEVAIHARPEEFMDWDKPLSQQNQRVRDFFKQRGFEKDFTTPRGYTQIGGDVYIDAAIRGSDKKNDFGFASNADRKKLSEEMLAAGIPGIKYLDAGSRDAGSGTLNYVVFHPKHLEIKRRYADGGMVGGDPFMSSPVPIEGVNGGTYVSQGDLDNRIQQAALGQGYADGGQIMPQLDLNTDPTVQQALDITRQAQPTAPQMARQTMQSPKLASTFQAENRPSVIVSPRPGKVGGPPIQREMPEGLPEDFTQEREPWSFATPNIIGASQPPPIQHPVFNEPRMEKITNATRQIFKNKEFHNLVNDLTGLKGLTVTPTVGTWMNEMEPSFILSHPDMTDEHAKTLAHLLGFGFQQDATVQVKHNPNTEDGIPAMLAGSGKKLTPEQVDAIHREATKHGMDFTITGDGKAAKFLHFGDETDLPHFMDKVQSISNAANLPELYTARTAGDLIDAQAYLNGIFRGTGSPEGDQTGTGRSPDLFRRVVDHVLAPYAKAVAGEGYRLSPERLAQTYALNDDEREHVRGALYPGKKDDRTTVPLMTGEEQLDVRPTGERGRASVGDVLYALQNRAAAKGQIDPGDFSDNAKKDIAQNIAREVAYHVKNSDKSAIGWYDDALKGAMSQYSARFPELETDPEKRMLFHALLGITSQGNDVYSNSIHAMRLYDQVRSGEKSLPEAVNNLKGSFGDKTRAIESNLLKFHHLLENNGYDRMSDLFNQTKTVGEWNKILREDKSLRGPGDDQLKMQGGANQKVTGWMVFGPKIGSFINNLHGDYSTLTADLWFSRTWNRLLGHNFIHTPLAEAKQYRDFRDALRAEYYSSNPNVGVGQIPKTEDGKVVLTKKGQPEPWEYGSDAPQLSKEEFEDLLNDPDKMLSFAQDVTKRYRDSQFKDKSDLRRRAKNWIENRELPVAAPRGDLERQFQQNTVEEAQRLLKKKYGMDISVADIQAALWFHEKELFGKLGVASEKAQPADYADAARRTMQLIDSGELYRVKSKEKGKKAKPQEQFASGGITMPSRDSAMIDRALRLTASRIPTPVLAELFQRQLRGK